MEAGSEELYHLFQGTFNRTAVGAAKIAGNMQQQQPMDAYGQHQLLEGQPQMWNGGYAGSELDFGYGQQQQLQQHPDPAAASNGYPHHQHPAAAYPIEQQHQYGYDQQQYNFVSNNPAVGAVRPPPQYQAMQQHSPVDVDQQQQQQQQPAWMQQQQQQAFRAKPDGFEDALSVMENHAFYNPAGVAAAGGAPVPIPGNGNNPPHPPPSTSATPSSPSIKSEIVSPTTPTPERLLTPSTPEPTTGAATSSGPGRKRKSQQAVVSSTKGGGGSGGKRKKAEEFLDPATREEKERERRFSNNTRERMRIRDINDALGELGRICMNLRPKAAVASGVMSPGGGVAQNGDKPQTKLAILNLAVDVITSLEQKVRERNLNPSALVLQRGGIPPNAASMAAQPPPQMGGVSLARPPSASTTTGPMSVGSVGSSGGTPSPGAGGGGAVAAPAPLR